MKGSLDTSVLVQLVTGQRSELVETVENFLNDTTNKFAIADAALLEFVMVLEKIKQLPRKNIAILFEMLETRHTLSFNRKLFKSTMALYLKHPKLSFYDCYLSADAEIKSATPLWTLDKKLAHQSSSAKLVEDLPGLFTTQ